ncbi:MAG: MotA/TolQ/ExbB proton channel family protein [Flavobacteriales bacterium]|jgi:biopolymer transport protein ExbB|nr:MotA/TolQ/ExbB proton channel family protein [Flavobacteriales bacterium]MBT3678003.1 MotA/TolQ/ExbB proton channel family protein [Flavobacteriales bacterium]MBT4101836.1 MotA/TolQ/ExbB proton channel family protein [Flavobacteriales bacterium]MBT5024206.1 MotA/TolQ/ExbB proton channel family protein [Flavobacteriales bacterium]MBT5340534.1 MotA/TolQ/ExbB proton channel family protein [Flavobacteriales bacterium]
MKKVFALLLIAGMLFSNNLMAQEAEEAPATTEEVAAVEASADDSMATEADTTAVASVVAVEEEAAPEEEASFTQVLKKQFIDGNPAFMSFVLVCLILGLALAIERIIYLTLSTTNNDKLLAEVESALNSGGVDAAKDVCRNARGPVASIFYQGLDKAGDGLNVVDKAVVSVGSVENGKLERGVSWISLFIALAPMLGFMGTVIGMIDAFDAIEDAGDISPGLVAGGIKVALLTTVFGLITAIILQVFFNLIVAMIDNIVNKMEDASISFLDIIAQHTNK